MSKSFEEMLAKHCAPTLCKIKSANLISCKKSKYPKLLDYINEINELEDFKCVILREINDTYLLLIYNKSLLSLELSKIEKIMLLKSNGYPINDIDMIINHLKKRIKESVNFPHEIGIFLGYPVEDILGFINNEECLYTGYWKVYKDLNEKKNLFNRYNECVNYMLNSLKNGLNINMIIGGNENEKYNNLLQ